MDNLQVRIPVTSELPVPETTALPSKTQYECDVLVIGGGFAGLNAAMAAKRNGYSVVMVDKGRPGFSGQSPWVCSTRYFDADMGDDAPAHREKIMRGGEYVANMDWYNIWIKDSRATYERLKEWGILDQYLYFIDGDWVKTLDFPGYQMANARHDRHKAFMKVLRSAGVDVADFTMITDVVVENGRAAGAIGFHVPSGAVITCYAKAVVMAMGNGSYKPTGFPIGGNTFDGEYIAYNLGLAITGKEYEDFHSTVSWCPGAAFMHSFNSYQEKVNIFGGDVTSENVRSKNRDQAGPLIKGAVGGVHANTGLNPGRMKLIPYMMGGRTLSGRADDPRQGDSGSSNFAVPDVPGAAIGASCHLTAGVYNGEKDPDLVGFTGIPGLYVAGDGMNGSTPGGASYPMGVGFTSCYVSIQGNRAGEAAAKFAGSVPAVKISEARITRATEELLAPMHLEKGFDSNWARDVLHATMTPYWIHTAKKETTLRAALAIVENMRDDVVPKLMACSTHDLRLCHEMKHKVLSAEMKLRAGLERKESRGCHYRVDYPYRNDNEFLCYITVRKAEDGSMKVGKAPVKDDWKGDPTLEYSERYDVNFPGEIEAKGLQVNKEV